jgi:hypothetical protein
MFAVEATHHCARASAPAATTHAAGTEGGEVKPRTPQGWTGGEEGVKREKPRQRPVEKDEAASVGVRVTVGKRGKGRNQDTQRQADIREAPCARSSSLGEAGGHRAVVDMEDREDTSAVGASPQWQGLAG